MTTEMLKNGLVFRSYFNNNETFIPYKHIVRIDKTYESGYTIILTNNEKFYIDEETYLLLIEKLGD
jgi:hypothetical protein